MVLVSEFIISSTSSLILQGRALIPTVKHERRDGSSSANPYMAFRKRTEKMQTRKVSLNTSKTSSSKQYLHAYYMYAVGTMFSVCRCACEGTLEHTKWFTSTCTLYILKFHNSRKKIYAKFLQPFTKFINGWWLQYGAFNLLPGIRARYRCVVNWTFTLGGGGGGSKDAYSLTIAV